MKTLPIRLFHASLLGMFLGTAFSLIVHHAGQYVHPFAPPDEESESNVPIPNRIADKSPPAATRAFLGESTDADIDGDGMPNEWESQFHHNPDDATDASADFDNDGLTALQE